MIFLGVVFWLYFKKFNVLLSGQLAYIYYGFGQYEIAQKHYKQKLNLIIEDLYECKCILFKFFIEIKKLIFLFSK